jgi:AraC-like DNA-binding protein
MSPAREEIFEIDLARPRGQADFRPLQNLRLLALGTKVEPPGATFGPRNQYSWLLVWVRSGTVRFTIDDTTYDGEPGSVFLVAPRSVDSHDWSERERTSHSFIHFSFEGVARGWPPRKGWPAVRSFPQGHPIFALFEYVVSIPNTADSHHRNLVVPTIELILRLFLVSDSRYVPGGETAFPELLRHALGFLHEHVERRAEESLPLGALARSLHVSSAHLCRSFQRHLGIGPMRCLVLMRLDKAVRLLERTELRVKEVADRTGFGNAFHLSAAFRKTFGLSPSKYRAARAEGLQVRNFSPALRSLSGQRILIDMPAMRVHMSKLRRSTAGTGKARPERTDDEPAAVARREGPSTVAPARRRRAALRE